MKIHLCNILLVCLLGIYSMNAQDKTLLEGKIETEYPVDFQVNIINASQHTGTISQMDGSFSITASIEDEILFSAMGFMPYTLLVTEEVLGQEELTIHLRVATNTLAEVKLHSSGLTGDIKKDAAGVYIFDQSITGIPLNTAPKMTKGERRYYAATSSAGGLPLDLIINSITGELKRLKQYMEYEKEEAKVDKIAHKFDLEFLETEMGIPEDEINLFLYYCLTFSDLDAKLKKGEAFELLDFLKEKSKLYLLAKEETEKL